MALNYAFSDEDMAVDEHLGYPKAYAKLCQDREISPYDVGPPLSFTCYALPPHEAMRVRELDEMFPILDPKAKSTARPRIYMSLLWKQLNHLGNAGFDPAVIRVDPYGNVLYYHADSASPLAWDIDHWFPCSRGGLTLPSNLRILQWQVCRKKHNKLEFLVPWWDLQVGISVNQFLSIFASSNSDFRRRGFSFLFAEGEMEELNDSQTVESHCFPQHFVESKAQFGLAPAAIVVSRRRELCDPSSPNCSRPIKPQSPATARKVNPSVLKGNEEVIDFATNPYQAIVMARNSLKQKEESQKLLAEMQKQDEEANELRKRNDEEKLQIQDLESALVKRRRRVEKCRRLAEAQSSYRAVLEKMIRDAMHQSVIYKEQVRLNQAATNALMARLEAQKAICDASEKELHIKFRQRDELEKQLRPEWEQARKRTRIDDTLLFEDRDNKSVLYQPRSRPITSLSHKELRVYLEEEQRASDAALSLNGHQMRNEIEKAEEPTKNIGDNEKSIIAGQNEILIEEKLEALELEEGSMLKLRFADPVDPEREEDEERRRERGKGNVERWLQMLLDNTPKELIPQEMNEKETRLKTEDEIIEKMNLKYPQEENKSKCPYSGGDRENPTEVQREQQEPVIQAKKAEEKKTEIDESNILAEKTNMQGAGIGRSMSVERMDKNGKPRKLERSDSARAFRSIPSSPSLILGMKKGVDCMRKKPMVLGDDDCNENENRPVSNRFKSPFRTIRNTVKL